MEVLLVGAIVALTGSVLLPEKRKANATRRMTSLSRIGGANGVTAGLAALFDAPPAWFFVLIAVAVAFFTADLRERRVQEQRQASSYRRNSSRLGERQPRRARTSRRIRAQASKRRRPG